MLSLAHSLIEKIITMCFKKRYNAMDGLKPISQHTISRILNLGLKIAEQQIKMQIQKKLPRGWKIKKLKIKKPGN